MRDAHRKVRGIFCLLFVDVWTKSKAFGGTRPAGFDTELTLETLNRRVSARQPCSFSLVSRKENEPKETAHLAVGTSIT